jgi:hypothetical protein
MCRIRGNGRFTGGSWCTGEALLRRGRIGESGDGSRSARCPAVRRASAAQRPYPVEVVSQGTR